MKTLIIGGAGYIGSHCNQYFAQQGVDTLILDNLSAGHRDFVQWGALIEGDICDSQLLKRVFSEHEIDCVMHFSALALVGESVENPKKYYENNVIGTFNVLNEMVAHGVKKFVFSSTCATYGVPTQVPIAEDHPQNPINPYGNTKLVVERMLADYDRAYGIKSVCLRYFNACGADENGKIGEDHQPETHLIPLVLDAIMGRRKDIRVFGTDYPTPDGTCIRDYIHVFDLAAAHYLARKYLDNEGRSDVFNLGNGNGFSVRQVIQMAMQVTKKKCQIVEEARRPGDPPSLVGDARKAHELLGWHPVFSDLETIISHAWRWHVKRFGN